jgi:hypothetical protein
MFEQVHDGRIGNDGFDPRVVRSCGGNRAFTCGRLASNCTV